MNEKLRIIALQASNPVQTSDGLEYQVDMDRLFELLVTECASVADQATDATPGERILAHFGITV